jgi:hypothetical protein
MSAEATSWAWGHADRMESPSQLLVLLALAEHASPTGDCFPNRRTIAQMCGYSGKSGPGTVTKHMKKLEEDLGLIERTPRYEADREGRQTSNIYRLKLEDKGQAPSGSVATPPSAEQSSPPSAKQGTLEPGTSTPSKGKQTVALAADVQKVFDHHLAVFKPQRPPKLGPSQVKQIEKGLREYTAADLCVAIDGLFEWRKRKPGKTSLGAIFDTYPGGKPLVEQIGFFISQAKGSTGVGGTFPSADRAIVAENQRLVQRGHRLGDNEEAVQQAKGAMEWLRQHGIETVQGVNGGVPTFRPLGSATGQLREDAGGEA